jgi:hypothetical protein
LPTARDAWIKTVYRSSLDEEIVTSARDFVDPRQQTLIRAVLVCNRQARRLVVGLEGYSLAAPAPNTPLPFSESPAHAVAGTVSFAGRTPAPLASSLGFDRSNNVISGIVPLESGSDQGPFWDPSHPQAPSPGARLAALLPMIVAAQTAQGPVEITIPADVRSVTDVAAACAGASARAGADTVPVRTAPSLRTSFDCAAARSPGEQLVCTTPQLAAADLALQDYYRRNLAASNEASVGPGQRAFIARRNQCTNVACVAETYRARHEELAVLGYVPE